MTPTDVENSRHEIRRKECIESGCPLTGEGHCADHGAERERNVTTRAVGLWGLGIIIALLFTCLNVGIPIYQKISAVETQLLSVAAKIDASEARLNRLAERMTDHVENSVGEKNK